MNTTPKLFRLAITKDWESKWVACKTKQYAIFIKQDYIIRNIIYSKLSNSIIEKIEIERASDIHVNISIHCIKPGIVIGKKGSTLAVLIKSIKLKLNIQISINVIGIKSPDASPDFIGSKINEDLLKGINFKRSVKKHIGIGIRNGLIGIKVTLKGRIMGVKIAKKNIFTQGCVPLNTIDHNIQYSLIINKGKYGISSIKIWTCQP